MLTKEENELLTRVGPGTPLGELQRRYWHPIAALDEMRERWTKRIRLLGEDLVLFKDRRGTFGLVAEPCPHRRASLAYGIPQEDGIRCPYHGWAFDRDGLCTEQPNEPAGSTFREKVTTTAYPVQELGGVLFAYLGPRPAPLLPRMPGFVTEGPAIRMYGVSIVPCNWLQIMENSVDPIHAEWLHGHLAEFVDEQRGTKFAHSRRHLKIGFDEFEYGIYKRRLVQGASEDADDWRIGHPVIFPNTLAVGSGGGNLWTMHAYQIRVPLDDTTTMHLWYDVFIAPGDIEVPRELTERVPYYDVPFRDEHDEFLLDLIDAQDVMAWVTQGPIAERDLEHLGDTDRGLTLYRRMLRRELKKVAAGEDPIGVIRDPSKASLTFHVERDKVHFSDGFASYFERVHNRYCEFAPEMVRLFARKYQAISV